MWIQKCGLWMRIFLSVDPEMWIVDQDIPKFPNVDPQIRIVDQIRSISFEKQQVLY